MLPSETFFVSLVEPLKATPPTKAYISGLFMDVVQAKRVYDYSRESVVLAHVQASTFDSFQALGDWVLWSLATFPDSAKDYRTVLESIGRLNYYRCYKVLPSWRLYEELSDLLPSFSVQLNLRLTRVNRARGSLLASTEVG